MFCIHAHVSEICKWSYCHLRNNIVENISHEFNNKSLSYHYYLCNCCYCWSFQTLHLERTILRTASKLPGILRWFEVVDTETTQLSPIETAIDNMENMNITLRHLVTEFSTDQGRNLHPLTMRLNGILDAAVNGGITKYQEVGILHWNFDD